MYAPCDSVETGGATCREHCDMNEGCEFYSVARTGPGCNCTLKSWKGVEASMKITPATTEEFSEGLKHCDLSIFVHADVFEKNCDGQHTCVYELTSFKTWAMTDDSWKKVDKKMVD